MTLRLGSFIPHQLACVFTYAVATSIRCVSVVLIVLTVEAVNGDGTWWDRREAQEGKVGVWGGTVKVMPGARYMGGDGLGVNTFRFNSVRHSSDSEVYCNRRQHSASFSSQGSEFIHTPHAVPPRHFFQS